MLFSASTWPWKWPKSSPLGNAIPDSKRHFPEADKKEDPTQVARVELKGIGIGVAPVGDGREIDLPGVVGHH